MDKERVMSSGRVAAAWIWQVELGRSTKHYLGLPLSGILFLFPMNASVLYFPTGKFTLAVLFGNLNTKSFSFVCRSIGNFRSEE